MEEVISQAPEHISKEVIESIFKKNNENVIDTLVELWDIEVSVTHSNNTVSSNETSEVREASEASEASEGNEGNEASEASEKIDIHSIKNPEEKWKAIRNICDSYDIEMQAQLNRLKNRR